MSLKEIEKLYEVSQMMVTAHAGEKERLFNLSFLSDVGLFTCNLILISILFAEPSFLTRHLGPYAPLCVAAFSIAVFVFSFAANLLDWKVRSEKHEAAFQAFLDFKFKASRLKNQFDAAEATKLLERYATVVPGLAKIREGDFVGYKRDHKLKVFISKHLDKHPATNIRLLKLRLWFFQNFLPFLSRPEVGP